MVSAGSIEFAYHLERDDFTLDAGAASCTMLLTTLADGLLARLGATPEGTAP